MLFRSANLHVFPYSERPHTAAARWEGMQGEGDKPHTVPVRERRERAAAVRALGEAKARAFHAAHTGRVMEVLFESPTRDGMAQGHTGNNIHVRVPPPPGRDAAAQSDASSLRNTIVPVRLLEGGSDGMWGELEVNQD